MRSTVLRAIALVSLMVLAVAFGALRPTAQTPAAEADLGSPGGIAALPSSVPAIPGIANQGVPAIIGSGQPAIVVAFCDDGTGSLPFTAAPCANPIAFELTRLYPVSGAPVATFAASGSDILTLADNDEPDMDAAIGVVAVQANAGTGVNEVLKVTTTDGTADMRSTNIVVVDTILAWGVTGAITQDEPVFISYHCDLLGLAPVGEVPSYAESVAGNGDGQQGLNDMYNGFYGPNAFGGGPGLGWGSNHELGRSSPLPPVAIPDVWCGGNTAGSLFDDFVDFQTDKGMFSVDAVAALVHENAAMLPISTWFYPPMIDFACGEGKTVDMFDIDALWPWTEYLIDPTPGLGAGCDLDGWRNGVVTNELLVNGEVGVATVTAQQGGGVGPPRTVNVLFVGPAVGGVAELPALAGTSAEAAGAPAEGSGWSADGYAALAGGLAAAALALTAGAWYARKRWLR